MKAHALRNPSRPINPKSEMFLFDFISNNVNFGYITVESKHFSFLPKSSLEACNYILFPLDYEVPCPKESIKAYKPKI